MITKWKRKKKEKGIEGNNKREKTNERERKKDKESKEKNLGYI